MAIYTYIVDPGGTGDFTSLSAAIPGAAAGKTNFDIINLILKRTTSAKDNTAFTNGFGEYIVWWNVIVHPDYRHDGYPADVNSKGNYVYTLTAQGDCSSSPLCSLLIDGIYLDMAGTGSHYGWFANGTGIIHMRNCIVRDTAVSTAQRSAYTIYNNTASFRILYENCIACGQIDASPSTYTCGFLMWHNTVGAETYYVNCLAYDCTRGWNIYGGSGYTLQGCLALNCTQTITGTTWSRACDLNVVSDTAMTVGGVRSYGKIDYSSYFLDPANYNFTPRASSKTLFGLNSEKPINPSGFSGSVGFYDINNKRRRNGDIGPFTYTEASNLYLPPSVKSKYKDLESLATPYINLNPNSFPVWIVKPPLGTELDKTKSWYRDLRCAVVANQDGAICGVGIVNLVTGFKFTPSHADSYLRRNRGGLRHDQDGRQWTSDITPSNFGEQMTLVVVMDIDQTYDYQSLTNNPLLGHYGGLTLASRSGHDGTQYYATVERNVTEDTYPKLKKVIIGVIDFAAQTSVFYVDGVEKAGTMEYGPDPTIPNIPFLIAPRASYGTLHAAYYWSRCLTPAECKAISANPWQLFKAKPITDYFASGPEFGNTVMLKSPVYGATGVAEPVRFEWHSFDDAASYDLKVATDENFSNIVLNQTGITNSYYETSALDSGTTYYWKVKARYSG